MINFYKILKNTPSQGAAAPWGHPKSDFKNNMDFRDVAVCRPLPKSGCQDVVQDVADLCPSQDLTL